MASASAMAESIPRALEDERISSEAHDAVTRAVKAAHKLRKDTERRRHAHERRASTSR